MKLELCYPLAKANIIQGFGKNKDYYKKAIGSEGHTGIDFEAPDGTMVYAAHDGWVTFVGEDGSGGLTVVIRTDKKFEYNGEEVNFKTVYCHLKPKTFRIKTTDYVTTGTPIAQADNTGLSTGSHLHFSLKPVAKGEEDWQWYNLEQNNGFYGSIDPMPYFNGFYANNYTKVMDNLKMQISLLTSVVSLFKQLLGFGKVVK